MDITKRTVGKACHWADTTNERLAIVLTEHTKGGTATRLAVIAFEADESVAKFVLTVGAAM